MTTDVVLEDAAVYNYIVRKGSTVNTFAIELYMGELDSLGEKAALFKEKVSDQYVQEYLERKAGIYLTKFYSGMLINLSLTSTINRYATRFTEIVTRHPVLGFLKTDSPSYRALVEHGVTLPAVGMLRPELKLSGVQSWIDFVKKCPSLDSVYADGCAKAMADYTKHLVKERGPAGLKDAYAQMAEQLKPLPASLRTTLWIRTHRQLASKHNLQAAVEHFKAATARSRNPN